MLHGVLDPQPGNLGFALFDGDSKIFEYDLPMRGRDAAALPGFVETKLADAGKTLADVKLWTVGSGPGSFTFLRMVAALCAGWKYACPETHFRCVPGAVALAGALDLADGEEGFALYDGRNKEILCFGVKRCGSDYTASGTAEVLNALQAETFFASRPEVKTAVFACEAEAVAKIIPPAIKVVPLKPSLAILAQNKTVGFDDILDDLVYIRPALY